MHLNTIFFPAPFSNTYDDSVLVLGIASVFCVLKFTFVFLLLFIVLIHINTLIFHCSLVIVH